MWSLYCQQWKAWRRKNSSRPERGVLCVVYCMYKTYSIYVHILTAEIGVVENTSLFDHKRFTGRYLPRRPVVSVGVLRRWAGKNDGAKGGREDTGVSQKRKRKSPCGKGDEIKTKRNAERERNRKKNAKSFVFFFFCAFFRFKSGENWKVWETFCTRPFCRRERRTEREENARKKESRRKTNRQGVLPGACGGGKTRTVRDKRNGATARDERRIFSRVWFYHRVIRFNTRRSAVTLINEVPPVCATTTCACFCYFWPPVKALGIFAGRLVFR